MLAFFLSGVSEDQNVFPAFCVHETKPLVPTSALYADQEFQSAGIASDRERAY